MIRAIVFSFIPPIPTKEDPLGLISYFGWKATIRRPDGTDREYGKVHDITGETGVSDDGVTTTKLNDLVTRGLREIHNTHHEVMKEQKT